MVWVQGPRDKDEEVEEAGVFGGRVGPCNDPELRETLQAEIY